MTALLRPAALPVTLLPVLRPRNWREDVQERRQHQTTDKEKKRRLKWVTTLFCSPKCNTIYNAVSIRLSSRVEHHRQTNKLKHTHFPLDALSLEL